MANKHIFMDGLMSIPNYFIPNYYSLPEDFLLFFLSSGFEEEGDGRGDGVSSFKMFKGL